MRHPCRARHPTKYQCLDCIVGYCLECEDEHCAFVCCVDNSHVVEVFEAILNHRTQTASLRPLVSPQFN